MDDAERKKKIPTQKVTNKLLDQNQLRLDINKTRKKIKIGAIRSHFRRDICNAYASLGKKDMLKLIYLVTILVFHSNRLRTRPHPPRTNHHHRLP